MNRLVIVGNGFDLSCGLKTSYKDFLFYYIKQMIQNAIVSNDYKTSDSVISVLITLRNKSKINTIIDKLNSYDELLNHEKIFVKLERRSSHSSQHIIVININSKLLLNTMKNAAWSDIESSYYNELSRIYHLSGDKFDDEYINKTTSTVSKLNDQFKTIRKKLVEYITLVNSAIDIKEHTNEHIEKAFEEVMRDHPKDFYQKHYRIRTTENAHKTSLKKIIFLNFNYTELLKYHLTTKIGVTDKYELFDIHGTIKDPNEIIFGYGDDSHKDYFEIEQSGIDDFLTNIKSFYYSSNHLYSNLIDIIESDKFDVFVLGHSLGLSDRVLLKTIFEHDNCLQIRLFHQGSVDNHFKKRIALSRHFDDKIKMRSKIEYYWRWFVLSDKPLEEIKEQWNSKAIR